VYIWRIFTKTSSEMEKQEDVKVRYSSQPEGVVPLGKEIRISPKANATVNKPGFKTEFFVPTVNVLIGIGKDNTADLIMTVDAWEALKSGEEISITTVKEFREKFA
jgi:hypothetical protein